MLFASSWHIGGETGYALNFMSTVTTWPDTEYRPGHGAEVGFIAEYSINDYLALQTGLKYIGKSFIYHHTNNDIVINNYMEMDHFIELPFTLRYTHQFGDVRILIGGGAYLGIWFLSQSFGKNISASEDSENSYYYNSFGDIIPFEDKDNLFEAGVLAETGVSWTLENSLRLDFSIRYEGNMTSLVKDYQENTAHRYNDTVVFSVSCLVPVGGER